MAPLTGGIYMERPDYNTIQKLKKMLDTPEGEQLKRKFSNIDKDKLLSQLKSMNINNITNSDIDRALSSVSSEQLIEMLKRLNTENFKKR